MADSIDHTAPVFVHPDGRCESVDVGPGCRIWAFAHVLEGAQLGADCNIGDHAFVESGARLGNGVTLKNGVMVWDGVTLEDGVFAGPGVVFTNDRFPRSARLATLGDGIPEIARRVEDGSWRVTTRVGHGASLGAGAVIGPGVTIGRFATVGAGAVVTRDVAPFRLVVGNPARPIGWVCRAGYRLSERPDGDLRCPRCTAVVSASPGSIEDAGC